MAKAIAVQNCEVQVYSSAPGDVEAEPQLLPPAQTKVKAGGKLCYSGFIQVEVATATYSGYTLTSPAVLVIQGTATKVKIMGQPAVLEDDVSMPVMCSWQAGESTINAPLTAKVKSAGQTKVKAT